MSSSAPIEIVSSAAVFWDVTQRSPPKRGALRDIQKTAAEETTIETTLHVGNFDDDKIK